MHSLLARASTSTGKGRVQVKTEDHGDSWSIHVDATVGTSRATANAGHGWIAKGKAGQHFYAATNLSSFNRDLIAEAYRELSGGAGKPKAGARGGKDLQQQYASKVSEGERVEHKQQAALDRKIRGLKFSITMEPFAGAERDHKIRTHFEVAPNATTDDKDLPINEDLTEAAMAEGKRIGETLDKAKVCKTLGDDVASRLPGHAAAKADIEQQLARAIGNDKAFEKSIDLARRAAVIATATSGFDDFEPRQLEPSSGLANNLRDELDKAVSLGKDATGVEKHIAGLIKRHAGIGVVYDDLAGQTATVHELRKTMQSELDNALSALFNKHSVTETGERNDLKEYANMAAEDELKARLGGMREEVLKQLVADERVNQALDRTCRAEWTAACNKWIDSVIQQNWNPRKALIQWAVMAVYSRHLLATSESDAIAKSKTNAQYWPKEACEELVRDTLLRGEWVRGGGTVHAFLDFGRVIGFDGGNPSTNHRAEITQASPAQMHGHPRIKKG